MASVTFPPTVRVSSRLADWNSIPMRRARRPARSGSGRRVMTSPPTSTLPPFGSSRPARQANSVDFPEPGGPTTPPISPASTVRETPRRPRPASPRLHRSRFEVPRRRPDGGKVGLGHRRHRRSARRVDHLHADAVELVGEGHRPALLGAGPPFGDGHIEAAGRWAVVHEDLIVGDVSCFVHLPCVGADSAPSALGGSGDGGGSADGGGSGGGARGRLGPVGGLPAPAGAQEHGQAGRHQEGDAWPVRAPHKDRGHVVDHTEAAVRGPSAVSQRDSAPGQRSVKLPSPWLSRGPGPVVPARPARTLLAWTNRGSSWWRTTMRSAVASPRLSPVRATTCVGRLPAPTPCGRPPRLHPTSSSSTSACPTWTASRCAAGCAPDARARRSSCSPPGAPRSTSWSVSTPAPTTTSPNRSVWPNCWPGSGPTSAAPAPPERPSASPSAVSNSTPARTGSGSTARRSTCDPGSSTCWRCS